MEQLITLPPKTLVVLCGPAGSGKSMFAAQHFTRTQIVSSDFCRALINDSENYAPINHETFDLFHTIIQKRLTLGHLTVADSTALHAFARAPLLTMAQQAKFHTCLIVFNVPSEICIERDRQRSRKVPASIIAQQSLLLMEARQAFQKSSFHHEPWDQMHELGADVTSVRFAPGR